MWFFFQNSLNTSPTKIEKVLRLTMDLQSSPNVRPSARPIDEKFQLDETNKQKLKQCVPVSIMEEIAVTSLKTTPIGKVANVCVKTSKPLQNTPSLKKLTKVNPSCQVASNGFYEIQRRVENADTRQKLTEPKPLKLLISTIRSCNTSSETNTTATRIPIGKFGSNECGKLWNQRNTKTLKGPVKQKPSEPSISATQASHVVASVFPVAKLNPVGQIASNGCDEIQERVKNTDMRQKLTKPKPLKLFISTIRPCNTRSKADTTATTIPIGKFGPNECGKLWNQRNTKTLKGPVKQQPSRPSISTTQASNVEASVISVDEKIRKSIKRTVDAPDEEPAKMSRIDKSINANVTNSKKYKISDLVENKIFIAKNEFTTAKRGESCSMTGLSTDANEKLFTSDDPSTDLNEELFLSDDLSTDVNNILFASDDTQSLSELRKLDKLEQTPVRKYTDSFDFDFPIERILENVVSVENVHNKSKTCSDETDLSNSHAQSNSVFRKLQAALNENKNLKLKMKLFVVKSRQDAQNIDRLLEEKNESDRKVTKLEEKLKACELIMHSLKKELLDKQNLVRSLTRKPNYSVPYQQLPRYRREARIENLVESVEEIRGPQADELNQKEADREIISDLFSKLQLESPLVFRHIEPEDDFRVFLANGVTWPQRDLIKKELDKLGFNILITNTRLFKWKKEYSLTFEQFYETSSVRVNNVDIPLIQVKNVRALLEKVLENCLIKKQLNFHQNFNNKIWVSNVIDKGAKFTKHILLISNSPKPNSMKDGLILGVYKGEEDHETLRQCFGSLATQVNTLKTVTLNSVDHDVEVHVTGDMKCMGALVGIQTCSSVYFCIFCKFVKTKAKNWFFGQMGAERTLETLIENAKKYLAKTFSTEKERLAAAQESFSVIFLPMFLIFLLNFVPSALHLFLGIGNYLVKLLEMECIRQDLENIGVDGSDFNNRNDVGKMEKQLLDDRSQLKSLQDETDIEGKTLSSLRIMETTLANPPSQKVAAKIAKGFDKCHSKTCYYEICLLYKQKMPKSDKINCSMCNKWHHTTCQLYISKFHIKTVKKDGFTCDICQPPAASSFQRIERLLRDNEDEKTLIQGRIAQTDAKLESLGKIFKNDSDSTYIELQKAFKAKNAWKSAFNQEFNGNHLRKLFSESGLQKMFSVHAYPLSKKLTAIRELMALLQNIQSYSCARFLEDEEIDDLEESTKEFIRVFSVNFPEANVFPKLHWLGSHLIPFVRRKKTWGLLSEQPVEHFHAEWNRTEDRFSHISDVQEKMQKIVAFLNCKHFV